jgi:hypothetical protein
VFTGILLGSLAGGALANAGLSTTNIFTTTALVTVFRVLATRGTAGAKALLGENFWGLVGTDRYAAYNWIDPCRRQLCWAHLKRDFLALAQGPPEQQKLGERLLKLAAAVFDLWHRHRQRLSRGLDFSDQV